MIDPFSELPMESRCFINGSFNAPQNQRYIKKVSPINGQHLPELSDCDQADLSLAILAAKNSFESGIWRNKALTERKQVMNQWADLIEKNGDELACLDTLETGRALKNFLKDSIPKAIHALRWFAESVDKHYELIAPNSANCYAMLTREPLGIVGLIVPWNDPLVVAIWKLAPALLMGNSVILKPAEEASYSILQIAALATKAGLPDGVLNVLPGRGEQIGRDLALHPSVRGVFFTGSSAVGKKIMQYAGQSNMKKVGLECGGKSAYLVTKNCRDLTFAAKTLAQNMFYNQGQICSAPSRLIIDKSIKNEFLQILLNILEPFQPQDPRKPETEVGALVSQVQWEKVRAYIEHAVSSGFKRLTPELDSPPVEGGFYLSPTIFDDVDPNSEIAQEEIFGPVLAVIDYDSLKQGIQIANNIRYGLAAAVWSCDFDEALWCAQQLEAGIVHINSYGEDNMSVPFGGFKESGLGKDKSIFAFEEYSQLKSTVIKLNTAHLAQ